MFEDEHQLKGGVLHAQLDETTQIGNREAVVIINPTKYSVIEEEHELDDE